MKHILAAWVVGMMYTFGYVGIDPAFYEMNTTGKVTTGAIVVVAWPVVLGALAHVREATPTYIPVPVPTPQEDPSEAVPQDAPETFKLMPLKSI